MSEKIDFTKVGLTMNDKTLLNSSVVSQQRELLISFLEYLRVRDIANTKKDNVEVRVDLFIERNL